MDNRVLIDSKYQILDQVKLEFTENTVKNEPMLFNCDLPHAKALGGPITNAVLAHLPEGWKAQELVIDSRVHMLMKGWYPCIPGWHHDDVPRTRADGQPDYLNQKRYRSQHIVYLYNGDICPTAFAHGIGTFHVPETGVIYKQWHKDVERAIQDGKLKKTTIPSGFLVKFNDETWHTGTRAIKNGWRFFIRISRYFNSDGEPIARGNPRTNELRRQVQVYLDDPNEGW